MQIYIYIYILFLFSIYSIIEKVEIHGDTARNYSAHLLCSIINIMNKEIQNQQQQMMKLIDNHLLDEFLVIYRQSLCSLQPFEQIQILLHACRFGTSEFVHNILNEKSSININCRHSSTGYTPLFTAIRAKRHDIIKYLIEKTEADVNCNFTNNANLEAITTCLHEALHQRDLLTVKLLLQYGAIVNERHLYMAINECFRQDSKVSVL